MSNTFYVNASANNGRILNDKNNRYSYDLPAPLPLETGTQITAVSSFINLQGVNGASIEIPEEVREIIVFQYYLNDTSHFMPTEQLENNPNSNTWNTLKDTSKTFHATKKFGDAPQDDGNPLPADWTYGQGIYENAKNDTGYSEMIMPLVVPSDHSPNGRLTPDKYYFIPFCGKVEIVIPPGNYSISKISELISNQINQIEIPADNNNNFIQKELSKQASRYNGFFTNNTTCRNMRYAGTENEWDNFVLTDSSGGFPTDWNPYETPETTDNGYPVEPFDINEVSSNGFSAIAVHPQKASAIRKLTVAGYLDTTTPERTICQNLMAQDQPAANPGLYNDFFRCIYQPETNLNYDNYNIFSRGLGVGSTGIKLDYNAVRSGFSLSRLHTPRTIPTYDLYGNSMANAGQEAIFIKRQSAQNDFFRREEIPDRTGAGGQPARPLKKAWSQFLSIPMSRTTGIMILNWGLNTAQRLGSNPRLAEDPDVPELANGYSTNRSALNAGDMLDTFKTFREWFLTDAEAQTAWETTIWYRLGFTYDDIQNPSKFEKVFNPRPADGDDMETTTLEGFTTDQAIDSTILPTISTIYNSQGASESSTPYRPNKDAINPINGSISGIQMFNTMDINAPRDILNNNTKLRATLGNCLGAYKGSFYSGAVMRPVITTPREIVANRLPILSNNGYLLITSDLVEPEDITKSGTYIGVLDVVPKSSLSNQDFMSDRNVLTHTLSNPTVINSINISILNPDMTDIELEPNSNVLLQITLPQPKQTISLANEQLAMEQNAMINTVKQIQADSLGLNPSLVNFESSTIPVNNKVATQVAIDQAQQDEEAEILLRDPEAIFDVREREEIVAEPRPDPEPEGSRDLPPPQKREQEGRIARGKTFAIQKELDALRAERATILEGEERKADPKVNLPRGRLTGREAEQQEKINRLNLSISKLQKELRSYRTPTREPYKEGIVRAPKTLGERVREARTEKTRQEVGRATFPGTSRTAYLTRSELQAVARGRLVPQEGTPQPAPRPETRRTEE